VRVVAQSRRTPEAMKPSPDENELRS